MRIEAVELHEFTYEIPDIGTRDGHRGYVPGAVYEPPGFVLTIRADNGVAGHFRGTNRTEQMLPQIEAVAGDRLLGTNPLEREAIWQDLWHEHRHGDHLGLGPIDVALWDLAGRHHGASVSTLLGGYRREVPAYASTYSADRDGLATPDDYASFAAACADAGYPAFKIHGFREPDRDVEVCRAVADRVGDEMDLMLDPVSTYRTYREALMVGRALDELDFYWYEDPLPDTGESISASKRLTEALSTPILGLEHVRGGPFSRANHLAAGAVEMLRADAHDDGGITGVMKIANTVEAFGLDVELHLGGPAHLHCMSAIRNTNYFEHGLVHPDIPGNEGWMGAYGYERNVETIDDDGRIEVPSGPGLGVDIDWGFVEDRLTDHTVVA